MTVTLTPRPPPPAASGTPNRRGGVAVVGEIERQIRVLRGRPVLLDADLARIYGVTVRRLLDDAQGGGPLAGELCFAPGREELAPLGHDGSAATGPQWAFTEHGAFMAGILLRSREAMAVSVSIVRAFQRRRAATHGSIDPDHRPPRQFSNHGILDRGYR